MVCCTGSTDKGKQCSKSGSGWPIRCHYHADQMTCEVEMCINGINKKLNKFFCYKHVGEEARPEASSTPEVDVTLDQSIASTKIEQQDGELRRVEDSAFARKKRKAVPLSDADSRQFEKANDLMPEHIALIQNMETELNQVKTLNEKLRNDVALDSSEKFTLNRQLKESQDKGNDLQQQLNMIKKQLQYQKTEMNRVTDMKTTGDAIPMTIVKQIMKNFSEAVVDADDRLKNQQKFIEKLRGQTTDIAHQIWIDNPDRINDVLGKTTAMTRRDAETASEYFQRMMDGIDSLKIKD